MHPGGSTKHRLRAARGFTLAELLACGACAALLLICLGAAGSRHRDYAHAAICADHMHTFAGRFSAYLDEHKGLYPPSYVYPSDELGNYDLLDQPGERPFGIAHWSWLVFQSTPAPDDLFQCPAMKNGGAPRMNPGLQEKDWEFGQLDQNNQTYANDQVTDKQAPRMAYTSNSAILPQNKFTSSLSGGPRVNVLVAQNAIAHPSATILLTEFFDNWKTLSVPTGGGFNSKSHRPVNIFYNLGGAYNEYRAPTSPFIYGTGSNQETYGLLSTATVRDKTNIPILDYTSGVSQANAVGRHHPGGDEYFDGTANFLFIDGAVRRTSVWQTLEDRLWGDRYYSLTGENTVINY